jgi:hypothetical protein
MLRLARTRVPTRPDSPSGLQRSEAWRGAVADGCQCTTFGAISIAIGGAGKMGGDLAPRHNEDERGRSRMHALEAYAGLLPCR